jgi:hypothetical protein
LDSEDLKASTTGGEREVDDDLADGELVIDERGAWFIATRPRPLLVQ